MKHLSKIVLLLTLLATILCTNRSQAQIKTDILIVGGTESGWAAAIQAARLGVKRIVLVNDIEWLGGQYTAEAVCALDENRGVDKKVPFPRSGLFLELTQRFEEFNLKKYGHRQPGNAWTANSTIRPAEAESVFRDMLQPYIKSGQVTLLENAFPTDARLDGNAKRLQSVNFQTADSIDEYFVVQPKITIDASDFGDVIQLCGAAFEYGPDLREKYNEPSAPLTHDKYPITDLNPITWCMVIEETDQLKTIPKPKHYDDRRYFLTTSVTKEDYSRLGWKHRPHRPFNPPWAAGTGKFYQGDRTVYSQRRLIDSYGLNITGDQKDVILLNWSIQDYPLDRLPPHVVDELEENELGASQKNLVVMSPQQRSIVFEDAKRHSLGMLYHLQTTVDERMPDKAHSFRRFVLSNEFGTPDHLPPKPYIRESLRLKAMYMMREQDARNYDGKDKYAPAMYHDGIAAWQFVYDFHPTGRAFVNDQPSAAWEIYIKPGRSWGTHSDRCVFPLRSMIPEHVDGLIGAQKNLGYSSIVSSAVRLHDQSVAIGQAAGASAALCVKEQLQPREIPFSRDRLDRIRQSLCTSLAGGAPLTLWPFRDLSPEDDCFEAANLMAVSGMLPLMLNDVDFRPSDAPTEPWMRAVAEKIHTVRNSSSPVSVKLNTSTRGEFIIDMYNQLSTQPNRPYQDSGKVGDYDNDGISNVDDSLPTDPENRSLPKPKPVPLGPKEDGIPNQLFAQDQPLLKPKLANNHSFNFCGANVIKSPGFINDHGLKYTNKRGSGWKEDISSNNRQRNKLPESFRDTFLFTREHAVWQCDLENGKYRIEVCVGDSDHEQIDQRVTIAGKTIVDDVTTQAGRFYEATTELEITNGKLEIELGKKGGTANTCLNWVWIIKLKD